MPLSEKQIDKRIIDQKPYFGQIFAHSIMMSNQFLGENPHVGFMEHPVISSFVEMSRNNPKYKGLERRDEQIVFRPSWGICNSTLGIKFILWGRAYKVMRLLARGKKKRAKIYLNGKRKTKYK